MAAASDSMSLPVGFRLHRTEEELINHYLKNKIQGKDFNNVIPEIDILKWEPWGLLEFDDDERYYFSRPEYKFNNRKRANRTTEKGFWKITGRERQITGRERQIKARNSRAVIGKKRILTFHNKGKARGGERTNWVIHEYYIPETPFPNANLKDYVLIRLKKKDEGTDTAACDEDGPRTSNASDFDNQQALAHIYFPEETTPPDEIMSSLFATPKPPSYAYELQSGYESPTRRSKPMEVTYVTHQSKTSWNNRSAQSVTGRIRPVELQTGKSAGGSLIVCKTSLLSLKSYLPITCIVIGVIGICSYFFFGEIVWNWC